MPKSRTRQKSAYTPPPTRSAKKASSPAWVGPAMAVCFLLGIGWLVAYYISGGNSAVFGDLGGLNLVIGFGLICVGFGFATQWR